MKKILLALLSIALMPLLASAAPSSPSQKLAKGKLQGVGMPPEQAEYLSGLVDSSGVFGIVGYVPTMASTPVQGTNRIIPGLNVIPTTAANNAAIMGEATPVPRQVFHIYNAGGNTVRIKASGGATINGATAGGYITVPTLTFMTCVATSATNYACNTPVGPTPQGP